MGANKGDALLVVDCVTPPGGVDLRIDEWNIDMADSAAVPELDGDRWLAIEQRGEHLAEPIGDRGIGRAGRHRSPR